MTAQPTSGSRIAESVSVNPPICERHHLVEVAGLGWRCWNCGLPGGTNGPKGRPNLTELSRGFQTDKWGNHKYTPHYHRHFRSWRDRKLNILEIGIGGYKREGQGGGSLQMWKAYFPNAQIFGLDIEDKSFVDQPRIRTFQGDQTDPGILTSIVETAGELHIVIDDGSHQPAHVRESFRILFPLLAPDGIYVIEDTQTSYWPEWGGEEDPKAAGTSMDLVKDLIDGLNYEEFVIDGYAPSYTDVHVKEISCYHNLVFIKKGINREGTRKRRILKARYGDQ
jgi:hypothetical protein